MIGFSILRIVYLWASLMLVVITAGMVGRLSLPDTLIYLEHVPQESNNAIWILDVTQGTRYRLLQRPALEAFDLAPDGRRLAYQVAIGADSEIYLFGLFSTQHEQITASYAECPKWSPDGQTLVYQNYDDLSLYLLDVSGNQASLFQYLGSGISRCAYDWLPDGSALIHTDWPRPSALPARVVATDIATHETTVIVTTNRPVRQLTVAPDGNSISYNGQPYATIVNIATRDTTNIPYFAYTFAAAWSPTQERIAFGYQKPLLRIADDITRGIAVIDAAGVIQFQQDVGTVSHVTWWVKSEKKVE